MARSALGVTVVTVEAVLLASDGSAVAALTLAVSVIAPAAAGAVVSIVIGGAAPVARLAIVQVTSCPVAEHAQPVPLALTNVTPGGRVSVTLTLVAALGPRF